MRVAAGVFGCLLLLGSAALAQGSVSTANAAPPHRFEIGIHGGYVWTGARDAYYSTAVNGEVDLRDSAHWGITADFTVRPNAQAATVLSAGSGPFNTSAKASINRGSGPWRATAITASAT